MHLEVGRFSPKDTIGHREREVRILPPLPLESFVTKIRRDKLGLFNEEATLGVSRNPDTHDIVYFCFLNHPFVGMHLSQTLEFVAPYPSRDPGDSGLHGYKGGIIGDLEMPYNAVRPKSKYSSESRSTYLHRIHSEDPAIGTIYNEFVINHGKVWLQALGNNHFDRLFTHLAGLTIADKPYLRQSFAQVQNMLIRSDYANYYNLVDAVLQYRNGRPFMDFVKEQLTPNENSSLAKSRQKHNWLRREFFGLYRVGSWEGARVAIRTFLERLDANEQEEFALAKEVAWRKKTVFNITDREIVTPESMKRGKQNMRVRILDSTTFALADHDGTSVTIQAIMDSDGRWDWHVIDYDFSDDYRLTGLYPLIAWEKNREGKRRFVSQSEIAVCLPSYLPSYFQRGDVVLGKVLAMYASPAIVASWQDGLPLKYSDRIQKMMGAQMVLWGALPNHASQLLSEENWLFSALESSAERAPAQSPGYPQIFL